METTIVLGVLLVSGIHFKITKNHLVCDICKIDYISVAAELAKPWFLTVVTRAAFIQNQLFPAWRTCFESVAN